MKNNKCIVNREANNTTYMFNSFDYETSKDKVLIDIIKLMKTDMVKVVIVIKNNDIFDLISKIHLLDYIELRKDKLISTIEFDVEYEWISKLISFATVNSERTEIYIGKNIDKLKLGLKQKVKKYDYDMTMVINDNNQTFINVKNNITNYSWLDSEIKMRLEIIK